MELQQDQTSTPSLEQQYEDYNRLHNRGLSLDALDAAERDHGSLANWQHSKLRVLAVKALSHLGLRRSADAIVFNSWRKNPQDPLIAPYYLQAILGWRGPLKAWDLYRAMEESGFPEGVDQAYLLCIKSEILSQFRDFASAEQCLREAAALDDGSWIRLRQAQLLHESDQHQSALQLSAELHAGNPDYIGAAQNHAFMLQRDNQTRRALELLLPYSQRGQSLSLQRQVFQLALQLEDFDCARTCLEKMEQLMVRGCPKYLRREQDNCWADYHCARGEYDAALPYLEQKSFYHTRVSESIRNRSAQDHKKILPLPFVQQQHMTCAPASIATVLHHWGERNIGQDEIAEAICYRGTSHYDQRNWLQQLGWTVIEFELNFPQLQQLIDDNIPVLLTTVEPGNAHLQVIAGYDQALGTYILRDPSYPRLQEMLIEESERYYASSGPRCMLVAPAERARELVQLKLRAAPLYDHYFQLQGALDRHQYGAAKTALAALVAEDTGHRLTLQAQLDMAYYSQDDHRILQFTEALLERFAEDVNLQLGKIHTLARVNAADRSLGYMQQLESVGKAHFLVRSKLADALRFDHRNLTRVEQLLAGLLRQNPLHAQTLYEQAGLLWDRGQYERAANLYRFVTCLEETNEAYASSYFKAERYLKRTDAALDFLRDRYRRFGKKSSGPAISLFQALDALERIEEGLQLLRDAIELRPDDGELMLFTARRLLCINRAKEAVALTNRAKRCANRNRHLEVAAEICAHQQARDKAIELWRKILETEPLNYDACNTLVRLLIETDRYPQALALLEQKIGEFPGNYQLQRMRLGWLADDDVEQIEACCLQLIETHPDDNWAFVRLAYLCTQRARLDDALKYAREATAISRTDAQAWTQLGHVYVARQETAMAIDAFKQAIAISCDSTAAFAPLLQCAHGLAEKKQLLTYIHEQLMQQVSYGDGILCYQSIGQQWLPADELLQFLHRAVDLRPDLWHSWLALTFGFRNRGDLDRAQATLQTALKRFPLLPRLHLELAEILRLNGDLTGAEQRLRHALQLNPDWPDLYNKLADLLEYQGRYAEAISSLEGAIRRIPNDAIPRGYLADLLWRRDQQQRAIDEVIKCVELSPTYGWAWHKLCQWSRKLDKTEIASARIGEARVKFPNSALLARVDAEFREDPQEKIAVLAEFADAQPQNIDIACRYIDALAGCGRYREALEICAADYWQGQEQEAVPIEIQARHAWLVQQQGNLPLAIEQIQKVTESAPYYYEGWRLQANWALDAEQKDTARNALEQCRDLYPNDPGVLTFVAEGLQRLGDDDDEILPLLKRAFELEPSDQYNSLTYLDQLIASGLWVQAREVVELIKLHNCDAFVLTRELQILAEEPDTRDSMLKLWSLLLVHPQANDWVLRTGWQVLANSKLESAAADAITELRTQDKTVQPQAGYWLGRHQLQTLGVRKFEKQFRQLPQADTFTQRALEAYLDRLSKRNDKPGGSFADKLEKLIAGDTRNWGTYGMLLVRHSIWYKARHWHSRWREHPNADAWMLYLASLSYRQTGDYAGGVTLIEAAYRCDSDNYRGDIVCWQVLHTMLQGQRGAYAELQYIRLNDLDHFSRYALSLCEVLALLDNGGFVEKYRDLSPKLRAAQFYYQRTGNGLAAQQIKRLVQRHLKSTIQLSGLRRLFWTWRLSNHF